MVDCGESVELGIDVSEAPSEVWGGFTLGSDGVLTLGTYEGSFLWIRGVGRGVGGGVWEARRRICYTCR